MLREHEEITGIIRARVGADAAAAHPGLAERRADLVVSYLVGRGVARGRLRAQGIETRAPGAEEAEGLGFAPSVVAQGEVP